MRRLGAILLTAWLVGGSCDAPPTSWIDPFDGQTAVPTDAVLRAVAAGDDLPPDWPAPDPIRVVDLDAGGAVAGRVTRDGDDLVFTPLSAWEPDHRYAWTVDLPEGTPHGPELRNAPLVEGTAVFSTSAAALDVVGVAVADASLCVLFSRPPDSIELEGLALWINEVPVGLLGFEAVPFVDLVDEGGDAPVGAACGTPDQPVAAGAEARVRRGEADAVRFLVDEDPSATLRRVRRQP
jgi:hypothetical protein